MCSLPVVNFSLDYQSDLQIDLVMIPGQSRIIGLRACFCPLEASKLSSRKTRMKPLEMINGSR